MSAADVGAGFSGLEGELAGQVAVVTGSARNIGRAIAMSLADAGAAVVINARTSTEAAEKVADEIRAAGGRAAVKVGDITNPEVASQLIATAVSEFGRLDILVNNAAVRREMSFAEIDYKEWREVVATTLDAAYLCCHAALPHLVAAGSGTIINIGGLSGFTGATRRAHVIAAKTGLVGLTRALAHDLAPNKITVNLVAPGLIATARTGPEPAHHALHAPPVGRRGKPEEVAALVRFLCGPGARYITGQTIHANGGAFI